jgi:hypothetical protein
MADQLLMLSRVAPADDEVDLLAQHLGAYPAGNADIAGLVDEERANRVGKPGISPRAA